MITRTITAQAVTISDSTPSASVSEAPWPSRTTAAPSVKTGASPRVSG